MKEEFHKYIESNVESDFVLIACGLPATFKTETTEEICKLKKCPTLRSDIIRLEVLKNEDIFDNKVASNMNKRTQVYDEVFRRAEETLKTQKACILDATFVTQELRKRAAAIANRFGVPLIIMQTNCPQEVSLKRISKRSKEKYESNAITEEAYLNNKKKFENVDLDDLRKSFPNLRLMHLIVDTQSDEPENWFITGVETR